MFESINLVPGTEGMTITLKFDRYQVSIVTMDDRVFTDIETLGGMKITGAWALNSEVATGALIPV